MKRLSRVALVATLLLVCVGCDQASKQFARAHLKDAPQASFLNDALRLTYAENSGAFLGIGGTLPEGARVFVFQGAVGLLVIGLVWGAFFLRRLTRWQVVGTAFLAASGLGNLIDRFVQEGRVTDFLNLGIGGLRTGIFNVADTIGVVGVAVLLLASSLGKPEDEKRTRL